MFGCLFRKLARLPLQFRSLTSAHRLWAKFTLDLPHLNHVYILWEESVYKEESRVGSVADRFEMIRQARWAARRFCLAHDWQEDRRVYLIQGQAGAEAAVYNHPCLPAVVEVPGTDGEWLLARPVTGESLAEMRLSGKLTEEMLADLLLAVVDGLAHLGRMTPAMVPAYLDPYFIKASPTGWILDYVGAVVHSGDARWSDGVMPVAFPVGGLIHWLFTGKKLQVGLSQPKTEMIAPWVSPELQAVMRRCLDRAYGSPEDLRQDLVRLIAEGGLQGLAARLSPAPQGVKGPTVSRRRASREARSRRPSAQERKQAAAAAAKAETAGPWAALRAALDFRKMPPHRRWITMIAGAMVVVLVVGFGVYDVRARIAAARYGVGDRGRRNKVVEVEPAGTDGSSGNGAAAQASQPTASGKSSSASDQGKMEKPAKADAQSEENKAGVVSSDEIEKLVDSLSRDGIVSVLEPGEKNPPASSKGSSTESQAPIPPGYDYGADKAAGGTPLEVVVDGNSLGTFYLYPNANDPQVSLHAINRFLGSNYHWEAVDQQTVRIYDGDFSMTTTDYSMIQDRLWVRLTPEMQQAMGLKLMGYQDGKIAFSTN